MRVTKYKTLLNDERLPSLVKESAVNYNSKFSKFVCPSDIVKMLNDVFDLHRQTEEFVYELCLNTAGGLIGVFEISHGVVNSSLCSNREIMMKALLCNASSVIIVHNHPSGEISPSSYDFDTEKKIKEGCNIMGVPLLDFIIIGDNDYYSFNEERHL